jgi:hypothetical protein
MQCNSRRNYLFQPESGKLKLTWIVDSTTQLPDQCIIDLGHPIPIYNCEKMSKVSVYYGLALNIK